MPRRVTKKRTLQKPQPRRPRSRAGKETIKETLVSQYKNIIIGAAAVVLVAAVALLAARQAKKIITNRVQPTATATASLSQVQGHVTASATPPQAAKKSVTTTPAPTAVAKGAPSLVKKLPFTAAGQFTYTIVDGDSLAKIGQTFCGDSRAYLHLAEINNESEYTTLHPGDTIRVSCGEETNPTPSQACMSK